MAEIEDVAAKLIATLAAQSPVGVIQAQGLPKIDLLDDQGRLKLRPAAWFDQFPHDSLRLFAHLHGRYGIPTVELIEWLKPHCAGRNVIEIGSGAGDLAYHLGIRATDNRMQEWPAIQMLYQAAAQPLIAYPRHIEGIDALDAVRKYRPEVVIASWVTEWIDSTKPASTKGGNACGVKEDEILKTGAKYILIGNQTVHGAKTIMALDHIELTLPFLRSRSISPGADRIYIWNGDK